MRPRILRQEPILPHFCSGKLRPALSTVSFDFDIEQMEDLRVHGRTQRGPVEGYGPPLNLWHKVCFSLKGETKILNTKADYRKEKEKGGIIINIDFWTEWCTCNEFTIFLTFWAQYFLINPIKDRKSGRKREKAEKFPLSLLYACLFYWNINFLHC